MTKLHFSAGVPGLSPRPPSAKFYAIVRTKLHPYPPPLYKNTGGGKGQKRKGLFP